MSFGNPVGFLALAGIPVVLLIHLLQVRSRRVAISTLFLLEPRAFERSGGRKLDRLRNSPLLWLQILAVLLATWLLVEPRWLREDSTERVVIVVDGSASMSAFRGATESSLSSYMETIELSAARIEWIVLGSDPTEKTLYSGTERERALRAAADWRSFLGVHDLGRVVSFARPLAGRRGRVVLVSDHAPEVPPGVELLAVGTPLDNVGFVSVAMTGGRSFRAIVKNAGTSTQTRQWRTEVNGVSGKPSALELAPGEIRFLSGVFPAGVEQMELVLESDRFELDDRLPIVLPHLKTLRVYVAPSVAKSTFIEHFLDTIEPFELAPTSEADLVVGAEGPRAAIVFAAPGEGYRDGSVVVENDPLVDGLDFRGLIAREPMREPEGDVLVWQGMRPLVTLRGRTLYLGFPLEGSNADRIPAFVLALHRFAESARLSKVAFEQRNVETRQLLTLATEVRRAPSMPGFFDVAAGEGQTSLFHGAAHFADVREGDFTQARSRVPDGVSHQDAIVRNSQPDPLAPLWLLGLTVLATCAFWLQEKGA